jgi:hypothetical protein
MINAKATIPTGDTCGMIMYRNVNVQAILKTITGNTNRTIHLIKVIQSGNIR